VGVERPMQRLGSPQLRVSLAPLRLHAKRTPRRRAGGGGPNASQPERDRRQQVSGEAIGERVHHDTGSSPPVASPVPFQELRKCLNVLEKRSRPGIEAISFMIRRGQPREHEKCPVVNIQS
jgi:hypothetical protein